MDARRRILFLGNLSIGYNRQVLCAMGEYASQGRRLRVVFPTDFEACDPRTLRDLRANGLVLGASPPFLPLVRRIISQGVPTVDVSAEAASMGAPRVATDDHMVGEMAAQYYISKGFRNLIYYGMAERHWSENRWRGFEQVATSAGLRPQIFNRPVRKAWRGSSLFPCRDLDWIKSLPAPAAIFGGDDLLGAELLESCHASGIRVPVDVAILSVDNDDIFGSWRNGQLSTIRLNTRRIGLRAMEIIDAMVGNRRRRFESEFVPPIEVITRLSTNVFGVPDTVVRRALEVAQKQIGAGISVKWLASEIGVSRATLERRFMASLGKSPSMELARMQAERARRMLLDSKQPIENIAEEAGYPSAKQMRTSIRRQFGKTPSEIRQIDGAGVAR